MSVNDSSFTLPDGGSVSFTDAEWDRAEAAAQKSRDRLAQNCKHLIKSPDGPKPRKVDWEKIKEARERLERKERDALRTAGESEE